MKVKTTKKKTKIKQQNRFEQGEWGQCWSGHIILDSHVTYILAYKWATQTWYQMKVSERLQAKAPENKTKIRIFCDPPHVFIKTCMVVTPQNHANEVTSKFLYLFFFLNEKQEYNNSLFPSLSLSGAMLFTTACYLISVTTFKLQNNKRDIPKECHKLNAKVKIAIMASNGLRKKHSHLPTLI